MALPGLQNGGVTEYYLQSIFLIFSRFEEGQMVGMNSKCTKNMRNQSVDQMKASRGCLAPIAGGQKIKLAG